ncbi:cupin domain-containing protein [Paraburkholderia sp.]|uniref:cupin domain-containing protein n=1 Tax=Paraburkholderia sp. TaxID=1926495 RepID=UPI00239171FB|nr:cupin domain-containing protein [Paraburkholderia sp.]MDE1180844.1 cupin domain-containing protein [Paraburkholderia sp.]
MSHAELSDVSVAAPSQAADGGRFVSFDAYLDSASQRRPQSAHWPWSAVSGAWAAHAHGERGTVALVAGPPTDGNEPGHANAEAAPGVSLTVQIVEPQRTTRSHRHSFWHLYVVVTGEGRAYVEQGTGYALAPGDALYVPPWAEHRFVNPDGAAPLVLYAVQNLPQVAQLGTLVRESPDAGIEHVYRAAHRP